MAAPYSIISLITDGEGRGTTAFLTGNRDAWAERYMLERYRMARHPTDSATHPATLCFAKLQEEYDTMRSWFLEDGTYSQLLHSRHCTQVQSGPIGDGIGWDFTAAGELNPRMLQFKVHLISAARMLDALTPAERAQYGLASIGTAKTLAASAYTARAAFHRWRPYEEEGPDGKLVVKYSGADMSRRWVTFRTYQFLVGYGVPHAWAWEATKAKQCFGPTDEERRVL